MSRAPSLRGRILLGTSMTLTVVVALGAVAVWLAAQAVLYRQLDDNVREVVRFLDARLARPDPPPPPPPPQHGSGAHERHSAPPGQPGGPRGPRNPDDRAGPPGDQGVPPHVRAEVGIMFIQIVDAGGREVARSPSLPDGHSLFALVPRQKPGRVHHAELDGRPIRVTLKPLPLDPPTVWPAWLISTDEGPPLRPLSVLVAVDATRVVIDLQRLAILLCVLWSGTTALGIAVAWRLHRTILHPLTRLADGIASLGPEDLRARLNAHGVPQEMLVVPERLNALLERLEQAFVREKTTLANIAHELRTPIAGLRMTLELALTDAAQQQTGTLTTCLRITESMQGMIANLLTLAKLDAGQELPQGRCDLVAVARDAWESLQPRVEERGLSLRWDAPETAIVCTTSDLALMIVANLVDNAVSYATKGAIITITIAIEETGVHLQVDNPTDHDLGDVSQVFVPFWRGDPARTATLHCGLGLALVQRLVDALGGGVSASAIGPRQFRAEVRLPAA